MIRHKKTLLLALLFAALIGCNGGNWASGDRVLVAKCLYDTPLAEPDRYEIVVFKFPSAPMDKNTPKNYIKRLMGLPGELIAIFFGQVYRWAPGDGEAPPFAEEDKNSDPNRLWQVTHFNDSRARKLFDEGKFEILRKPPDALLALRRIVYDNDYPPRDLVEMGVKRWDASRAPGWTEETGNRLALKADGDAVRWLRYQHLVVPRGDGAPAAGGKDVKPKLITDQMGYNSLTTVDPQGHATDRTPEPNWVGDLMLECDVDVAGSAGEFRMELSRGVHRYQARWNLADGVCTLVRLGEGGKETPLGSKQTNLQGPGSHLVRFANVDARLIVWVDRQLPFGEGVTFSPPEVRATGEKIDDEELLRRRGPTANDLEPASLGGKGAQVTISHLKLWRDTYYTTSPRSADYVDSQRDGINRAAGDLMPTEAWSNPKLWDPIRRQDFRTWYVQPGHYMCLGDNSTASSDSREWGLVPDRLMLGRALLVYYPIHRAGPIR
jgi:signal peptidase I